MAFHEEVLKRPEMLVQDWGGGTHALAQVAKTFKSGVPDDPRPVSLSCTARSIKRCTVVYIIPLGLPDDCAPMAEFSFMTHAKEQHWLHMQSQGWAKGAGRGGGGGGGG